MLRRHRAGSVGQGSSTDREVGLRGRMGGMHSGPEGYCVCLQCGERIAHVQGTPCASVKCPKCGTSMVRGS